MAIILILKPFLVLFLCLIIVIFKSSVGFLPLVTFLILTLFTSLKDMLFLLFNISLLGISGGINSLVLGSSITSSTASSPVPSFACTLSPSSSSYSSSSSVYSSSSSSSSVYSSALSFPFSFLLSLFSLLVSSLISFSTPKYLSAELANPSNIIDCATAKCSLTLLPMSKLPSTSCLLVFTVTAEGAIPTNSLALPIAVYIAVLKALAENISPFISLPLCDIKIYTSSTVILWVS